MLKELSYALWQQNVEILSNPNLVWIIYSLIFIILFLENGVLPAAFLPGDSLLILLGILIAKGMLNFTITTILLTIAASLGGWVGYLQGYWLEKNKIIKNCINYLPYDYYQRAYKMFHNYGLSALLIGRFIVFVRTLLPVIAGLSGLCSLRFHIFNWISALLWIVLLILVGFMIEKISLS